MSKINMTSSEYVSFKNADKVVSIYDAKSDKNLSEPVSKQSMKRSLDLFVYDPEVPFDPDSLVYFQSSMFASAIEDTLSEVRILAECNSELRILKTQADIGLLLANKYSIAKAAVQTETVDMDAKTMLKEEFKLDKLENDRKYLLDTLKITYLDLSLFRNFRSLLERIAVVVERDNYHAFLQEDEAKNRNTRRELAKQLRQQRNHIKSVNYDTNVSIEELRTQVEDAALTTEIQSRYIHNWQVARTEQHLQTIEDKETPPLEKIELYKMRSDHEQRVHTEVEMLINHAINEKLEEVEKWMNKYDKDMDQIDLKIQIKKNDHTNQLQKRVQLEETFAKHEILMKDWIYFKDEREKARLYREKMTHAAVVVQAWWRGLLVRMQLGPYKPAKKARGKKKK